MNNKYVSTIILFSTFSFLFLSSTIAICQEKEDLVKINTTAQKELALFLEKIPNGTESEYGFNSREEFRKAKLLKPINIVFPSNDYYSNEIIDSTNVTFFPSQNWKIPISVNNITCCFLHGKIIENNFKVFGIGGKHIAKKLNKIGEKLTINSNMDRCIILFPEIKRQYLIYYNDKLTDNESTCISLNEQLDSDPINERSLFEILYESKKTHTKQKLRNNEY